MFTTSRHKNKYISRVVPNPPLSECEYVWPTHMSSACFIVQPFYKRSAQKGQSKQHCVCIKEKQNNSSQSFLRNPSTLKLPLAHVCWFFIKSQQNWIELLTRPACYKRELATYDHVTNDPLLTDPYECRMVKVAPSKVPGRSGHLLNSTLWAFYNPWPLLKAYL